MTGKGAKVVKELLTALDNSDIGDDEIEFILKKRTLNRGYTTYNSHMNGYTKSQSEAMRNHYFRNEDDKINFLKSKGLHFESVDDMIGR